MTDYPPYNQNLPGNEPSNVYGSTNFAREALVVVLAVCVGLLIVARGLDNSTELAADAPTTPLEEDADAASSLALLKPSTDPSVTPIVPPESPTVTTEAGGSTTTTTTVSAGSELRDPSEVAVLVLNANGVANIASLATDTLNDQGYVTKEEKNADANGLSAVLYDEGYEAEAAKVSALFGLDEADVVSALDPANPPSDDLLGANIIILLGTDDLFDL